MSDDRRTSKAWQFFTDLKDKDCRAKCNYCNQILSDRGGGPYNLTRHTKAKHPVVYQAITENTSQTNSNFAENRNENEEVRATDREIDSTPSVSQFFLHPLLHNLIMFYQVLLAHQYHLRFSQKRKYYVIQK